MRLAGVGVMAASAAMLWAAASRAESDAEYGNRPEPAAAESQAGFDSRDNRGNGRSPADPESRRGSGSMPAATADQPETAARPVARPPFRAPVFAASSAANAKPLSTQERDERHFLKDVAAFERFQSDAARLALTRSTTPSVHAFANSLLAQQGPAADEVVRLLHQRALAPPMLANEQRRTLNRLARLQGRKFDREFLLQVGLKSQQEALQHYERAAISATDPALRAWIDRNLPQLRDRLAFAEHVAGAQLGHRETRYAPNVAQLPSYGSARAVVSRPSESNTR